MKDHLAGILAQDHHFARAQGSEVRFDEREPVFCDGRGKTVETMPFNFRAVADCADAWHMNHPEVLLCNTARAFTVKHGCFFPGWGRLAANPLRSSTF